MQTIGMQNQLEKLSVYFFRSLIMSTGMLGISCCLCWFALPPPSSPRNLDFRFWLLVTYPLGFGYGIWINATCMETAKKIGKWNIRLYFGAIYNLGLACLPTVYLFVEFFIGPGIRLSLASAVVAAYCLMPLLIFGNTGIQTLVILLKLNIRRISDERAAAYAVQQQSVQNPPSTGILPEPGSKIAPVENAVHHSDRDQS